MEVLTQFSKLYRVMDHIAMMQGAFNKAWAVTCDYPDVSITTCTDGWALVEGNLSEADATAIEAELDAIFQNS